MKQLIACCGLDCENCDARIATVTSDDELREQTAQKWSAVNNAQEITAEAIDCMGCRKEGKKFSYCAMCGIRYCVMDKGFETCAECAELDICPGCPVLEHVPGAKNNLLCHI